MATLEERWAEDDKQPLAGLAPADEPLPPATEALSMAINLGDSEPWDRYMKLDLEDEEAIRDWEDWFRKYLRKKARR
ncbi:hypothetical protein [Candidatus Palauibacter sp.]|uniref:hypothetical protein n=1 Tax=Candidatus Palauibacter sp. TaxID=3101350 RepID=UPI003B0294D3